MIAQGCSVHGSEPTSQKRHASVGGRDLSICAFSGIGAPIFTEQKDEKRTDVFKFHEGSKSGWKVGRAVFHAAADVVTLGLWEIIGTPTEAMVKGEEVTVTVMYDQTDKVETLSVKGKNA